MPFARPSLAEIIDRVVADIGTRLPGVAGAVLRRSLLGIIGRAQAGAAHLLYGYIDWVARQALPDTAEREYLQRWAAIWGITRNAATFAEGSVTFTGTNGAAIPAGTIVQRQDGVQYATQAAATIAGGSATVAVEASVAGTDGNLAAGTSVFLISPIAGAQSSAAVAAGGITGGDDVESDERLLARLLQRIRNPPQGGAEADYVLWALEVPGVTRVWVYPMQLGAGTVTVLFVNDDDPVSIIPDAAEVAEVQAHIDRRRPVTAEVFVAAPTATPLDMTIALDPNTASVQQAVLAELQDLLTREAQPGGTILISRLREAVSIAAGEGDNSIITPGANVTHAAGEMAVLGTVTFQAL
ncbi:baseplate J/gp47 family protein [Azotobacter chroococcum]|uniref:baseplate J/gp47 family protein n=1 Tax=Azotobacter chroococcum TaxID=353 RepID=UPI0010AE8267|nr:baseplate J/gp47 family protein [Azotobacter chroococcum]TKD40591.1 baseplate J/gp47 family protein [Azotobacter chroococcum]